jgi:hypothetical protein
MLVTDITKGVAGDPGKAEKPLEKYAKNSVVICGMNRIIYNPKLIEGDLVLRRKSL